MKKKKIVVTPDDDLLNGLDEIAAFIKRNRRQTHYLTSTGKIPTTKLSARILIGSKRAISAALRGEH